MKKLYNFFTILMLFNFIIIFIKSCYNHFNRNMTYKKKIIYI